MVGESLVKPVDSIDTPLGIGVLEWERGGTVSIVAGDGVVWFGEDPEVALIGLLYRVVR
jgi:hypothetical protein